MVIVIHFKKKNQINSKQLYFIQQCIHCFHFITVNLIEFMEVSKTNNGNNKKS